MDALPELGFEKVAIFAKAGMSGIEVTHASRLLPNGCWTSKLGKAEDIEHHELRDVEGGMVRAGNFHPQTLYIDVNCAKCMT